MSISNWNPQPCLAIVVVLLLLPCQSQADEIDFERDIAPIFEERCWYCHGEDEQESDLRLDLRVKTLKGGNSGLSAVVPGKPESSYLIELINHVDEDMAMPPDEDKIPAEEIELLTRWIKEGAVWPGQMDAVDEETSDHWSFQSVVRPEVPIVALHSVDRSDSPDHVDNPVDAFLLQTLAENELSFSQPADPRSLIRRASIVLTGIAPTPEETTEFIGAYREDSDQAYAALVDRLLDSPHFGERWAQHWLDVIRWAETNGSEANLYRKNAWIYRDYVVRAFNEDKPYDQFVQEQLAGDSMGVGEATGLLVAGPHVPAATVGREPTAIRQARADRMDEVLQTVGASMMGVTIGCARCHNHKFDPITITDYYAMTGVFQDVEFGSRFPEFSADHPRRQRGGTLWKEIAIQRRILREVGGWEENWGAFRELHFKPTTTKAIRIRFKMKNVGLDELEVFGTVVRSENLAYKGRGTKVTGFPEKGVDGRFPIERLIDGEFGTMTWRGATAKGSEDQPWVRFDFEQPESINRLRLSSNREYFYDTDYLDKKPYLPRYEYDLDVLKDDGSWQPWVGTWYVNKQLNKKHPERAAALDEIQRLIETLAEEGPRPSFVGRFVRPEVTRVLLRGSPESPRDEVMPAGPAIFGGDLKLTSKASGSKRRAEFAKWISSAENPLTARVMANRIWHHVFGSGIVPTTSDFGKAGALPTHPELLDWLAAEFVEPSVVFRSAKDSQEDTAFAERTATNKPWSMKHLIRLLVMSDAFRQSSTPTSKGIAKDAGSALLWRFPPKRVEAEVIRDSILQASGSLDRTIGGRSYRIHNEKKTYAQWEVLDNHGPETWRRMLYQERMRRVDDGIFTAFDFPDCGQVRAKRPVSTTPLQALNLMNSDFVLEQAKLISERAKKNAAGDEVESIDECFQLLLGRDPDEQERKNCLCLPKKTTCRSSAEHSSTPTNSHSCPDPVGVRALACHRGSTEAASRLDSNNCNETMANPEKLSPHGRRLLDRRNFLGTAGLSTAGLALASLLDADGLLAADVKTVSGKSPIRPDIDPNNPYAARKPHFEVPAKQVLVIYLPGAVSHIDTFDYKPELTKLHGQKPPGIPEVTFEGPTGNIAKPFWDFKPRGETGKMVSDLLPNLAEHVDDFCFLHALSTDTSAHPQGENFMNTGFTMEGFPSFGAWVTYALGTENQELPSFVAINDPRGLGRSGKNNFGNGFLPAAFQGTDFNSKNPPNNLHRPAALSADADQGTVQLLQRLNARHLEKYPGDANLAGRIASYELAGKMQTSVPDVMDLSGETESTLKAYGVEGGSKLRGHYAGNCILARRLLEKGVRVVQLFNGSDPAGGNGITNWDSHANIAETHAMQAEIMDQPTAALIADMKQRGLLEHTLVVWATEFGRMPFLQANGTGRDHNPDAFTCFLTGAGVKRGFSYGESDEFGFKAIVDETTVYDFNATLLHLMGLDHERLTFYHNGLERRLTNVHGHVVKDVLA